MTGPLSVYDAIDQITDPDELRHKLHVMRRGFGAMSQQRMHFAAVEYGAEHCQPCRDYMHGPNDYRMCDRARDWQRDIDAAWGAL